MKNSLDSDWLRAVQFFLNKVQEKKAKQSAKQFKNQIVSKFLNPIFIYRCQIRTVIKNFRKLLIPFENFPRVSEVFRAFPSTSENFQKFLKIVGRSFWELSDIFRFFPRNSEDFRRYQKNLKNAGRSSWALCAILRFFPKTSVNFRRLPKISGDFRRFLKILKFRKLVAMFVLALSGAFS